MKARYDENKVYKEVFCDECGGLIGLVYIAKGEPVDITMVHNSPKKMCVRRHSAKLLPQIPIWKKDGEDNVDKSNPEPLDEMADNLDKGESKYGKDNAKTK